MRKGSNCLRIIVPLYTYEHNQISAEILGLYYHILFQDMSHFTTICSGYHMKFINIASIIIQFAHIHNVMQKKTL
jgi:hypothetical protein